MDSGATLVHTLATAIFCPCCGSDFHSVLAEGQLWAMFGARALPARSRKVLLQLRDPGLWACFSAAQVPWSCPLPPWLLGPGSCRRAQQKWIHLWQSWIQPRPSWLCDFLAKAPFPSIFILTLWAFPIQILISLKCFSSIFLSQYHFLKISMLPWKYWIMTKIHSQLGNNRQRNVNQLLFREVPFSVHDLQSLLHSQKNLLWKLETPSPLSPEHLKTLEFPLSLCLCSKKSQAIC